MIVKDNVNDIFGQGDKVNFQQQFLKVLHPKCPYYSPAR